jgi:hypothetical protein
LTAPHFIGATMPTITVHLPEELVARVAAAARREGMTADSFIL